MESLEVGHLTVESIELHERINLICQQNRFLLMHTLLVGAHLDEKVGARDMASRWSHLRFVVISSSATAGCICCSLVGDFRTALQQVVEQYHPDRIVIEPSGVGKLSDVTRAVQGVAEELPVQLNSFVTVADVKKVKMYMKNFGEFYNDQISHASCIILSRTGSADEEKVAAAVAMLKEKNPTATIVTTDWEQLNGKQILSVMDGKRDLVAELLNFIPPAE